MNEIQEILSRMWTDMVNRPDGPLALRFLLQPAVAVFLAARDGLRDARSGKPPYSWALVFNSGERAERLLDGMKTLAKILVVAVALDAFYQWKVLDRIYPGEALIVAFVLACVPYFLIRGPAGRIAERYAARKRLAGKP